MLMGGVHIVEDYVYDKAYQQLVVDNMDKFRQYEYVFLNHNFYIVTGQGLIVYVLQS